MQVLLIDNYDSFTQNIAHYLCEAGAGVEVTTVRNDEHERYASGDLDHFDACVISPGPGNVACAADVGISRDMLKHTDRPVLGVCLGHQLIAHAAGARVVPAREPVHGRPSLVRHSGAGLFAGLPAELRVMRYHSWIVDAALPDSLDCTAWTADGLVMALQHRRLPHWGVQFHPESIGTPQGKRMLRNFLDLAAAHRRRRPGPVTRPAAEERPPVARPAPAAPRRVLYWRRLARGSTDPVCLVEAARGVVGSADAVSLLESALRGQAFARFSYVGIPILPTESMLSYCTATRELSERVAGQPCRRWRQSVLDWLEERRCVVDYPQGEPVFDFHGGLFGWLGYELRRETAHSEPSSAAAEPDAAFRSVNAFLVVDHREDALYAAVNLPAAMADSAVRAQVLLDQLGEVARRALAVSDGRAVAARVTAPVVFRRRHSDRAYLERIEQCQRLIRAGESYELCLTNRLVTEQAVDSWALYKVLRARNPSPFSAFLSIAGHDVVCASPELFLAVDGQGVVHSKPIKGTVRRGDTPAEDERLAAWLSDNEKERAENLMITDLLRHDIAGVALPGSVRVPHLAAIETYPAVHQLVSTITGRLAPANSVVDLIRSAFPGGSMTGAPKLRSMLLLDALEVGARGVYSGSLGWLSHDGRAMLNIVIRSAVVSGSATSVGCGGAITSLSDPEQELEEVKLKSRALLRAIAETVTGDPDHYGVTDAPAPARHRIEPFGARRSPAPISRRPPATAVAERRCACASAEAVPAPRRRPSSG